MNRPTDAFATTDNYRGPLIGGFDRRAFDNGFQRGTYTDHHPTDSQADGPNLKLPAQVRRIIRG